MANKSILETASLDNPAVRTGYQVKAQPVDTFVRGPRNTKGMQVAQALEQVSGAIGNAGSAFAQVQAKAQSKEQEQITNLELLRASNIASEYESYAKDFAETYDYSIVEGKRPSSEEMWEAFTAKHPGYVESLGKLTTSAAKNSLNKAIGNTLYTSYGTSKQTFERNEEDVELGNYAASELGKTTLSASSPEFFEVFKSIDQTIQSTDRTPQEAKALLMSTALRAANETGDFRLYSILLGEVEGKNSILSNDEYKIAFGQREAVQNRLRTEQNRLDAEKVEGVKAAKTTLQTDIGTLFLNGEATTENVFNLVRTAEDAGVGSAASDADKILKAYKSLSTEEVEPDDMIELYDGYIQAPDKIEWLRLNSTRMDKSLLNTFLTQAPRENPYNGKAYERGNEIVKNIVRDTGIDAMFVEVPRFAPLRLIFEEDFKELSMSPEWSKMSLPERNDAVFKIIQKIQGFKKLIGEEDFLSPTQIEEKAEEVKLKKAIDGALGD